MNYIILPQSLILNHAGKTTTINKADGRYDQVIQKIKEGKLDEIIPLLSIADSLSERGFQVVDGIVHVDGDALPESLSARVLDFFNNNLPFEPLLKFWAKLKNNPSFNSRQMLFKFLEHNGHPITTEGNFIAYRAVRNDFLDKHTGKMDNSVGNVVEIDRSKVDDNPNNTCSHGLHVATMSYAQTFGSGDDKLLDVEVSPADVVAVPTDYNGTKMRVCRFKVVAESQGLIDKPLVQSSFVPRDDFDTLDHQLEDDEWGTCPSCGEAGVAGMNYCFNCGETL
jgi:hypothetical protein